MLTMLIDAYYELGGYGNGDSAPENQLRKDVDEDVANAVNLFTTDLLPPSFTMLFTFITSICSPAVCSLHTQRPAGQRNRTAKQ